MGKVRAPRRGTRTEALDPLADLLRRTTKLRGAPRGAFAACVRAWWREHELAAHPTSVAKRIALLLLEEPRAEPKQAAIALLAQHLGEHLCESDLPAFERLFSDGHLAEPVAVDGFSLHVLGTLLAREQGRSEVARVIASWREADVEWQRRAACLAFSAFAARAADPPAQVIDRAFALCAAVVWSPGRVDQTAVGATLRELGRVDPLRVEAFVRRHARFMSKECARASIARLPASVRAELLAHHKRATSLRFAAR
ncbi:MAG: DNA alkylation repair protein [Kofleriaceae bacterium]|nr:DNA alkylation repair protein [Kofleriaceae bacterium]